MTAAALFSGAALAAAAALAAPPSLQFQRAEDAVKYRQGALFVLGQHFARIGAMANGRTPYDAKAAVEHAEVVASLAKLPMDGFVTVSDKVSAARARPEVWSEAARFKEQNDRFVAESAKLLAAAKTNNIDQLKSAFSATAGTCKSCHDGYRSN
ncbi:MAG TPA: cytochrome c [Ramlibacter sp.]|nr:cytochrome c [Ramlibacter sp.]